MDSLTIVELVIGITKIVVIPCLLLQWHGLLHRPIRTRSLGTTTQLADVGFLLEDVPHLSTHAGIAVARQDVL